MQGGDAHVAHGDQLNCALPASAESLGRIAGTTQHILRPHADIGLAQEVGQASFAVFIGITDRGGLGLRLTVAA